MSDDTRLPLVPFDPREVGPIDVVSAAIGSFRAFLRENAPWVLLSVTMMSLGAWYLDVSIPEVPDWVLVGVGASAFAAPAAIVLGWRLGEALYSRDTVLLSVQNPVSGDQRIKHVAPERWEDVTVVNHNGSPRDRGFLHEVRVNGRRAFEVDRYDEEENTAVASWQAGVSNSEIRRERHQIKRIKQDLEAEADKAMELMANHPDIIRRQTREVSETIIKVAEGIEIPEGENEPLHERLTRKLDEHDPSEDLLSGPDDLVDGSEDVDDGPDLDGDPESIFERAVESNGAALIFGDDGDASNGTGGSDE